MFRYIQLFLTLALLSVFAHPAVAQVAQELWPNQQGNIWNVLLAMGGNEKLEIAFHLNPITTVDGQRQILSADRCRTQFAIEGRSATESFLPTTVDVDLVAGQTEIVEFDFSSVADGPFYVILEVSDVNSSGPCRGLYFARIVDSAGGTRVMIGRTGLP